MLPFSLRPDQVVQEITAFNHKLFNSVDTFADLDELNTGISPKEAVYQEDKCVLYRFLPQAENLFPVPLLINYALVNRPYMADLQDGRSIIQGLLQLGLEVYLIDWGYPDETDRYVTLDDYVNGYMRNCMQYICDRHRLQAINLLGICQGGTLACCYAAIYPEQVRNLITTVTPIHFHTEDDLLSHLVRHVDIDLAVDTLGNIPGEVLNAGFLGLKPYHLLAQKYVAMVDLLDDKEKLYNFMQMEKWIFDSPDQAGEAYRQFIKDFYQQNKLIAGEVQLGSQSVDLHNISMPVLNIYAAQDHLVPPASSKALAKNVGTGDYTELEFPGGHIGIYVSSKAQKMLPKAIADWLDEHR